MAQKNNSILHIIVLLFNIAAIVALGMSYLAGVLKPTVSFWIALCGLAYPYILAINVCFVIFWLLNRKKYALLSLVTIVVGFTSLNRLYACSAEPLPEVEENLIKIMSYNVQAFGGFDYQKRSDIIDFIEQEQPDILCLQEYWQNPANKRTTKKKIKYPYQVLFLPLSKGTHQYGMALFSKYPIVGQGEIDFSNSQTNFAHFADIVIRGDTVRVYNIHFQSIHFGKKDYDFASATTPSQLLSETEIKKSSIRILRKIKYGFFKRTQQVDTIMKYIDASPYKVLVCGDFNDTPWSYAYSQFGDKLQDAFTQSGQGLGHTKRINWFLSFRIDYLYHDKSFQSYAFTTSQFQSSDHYPVYTYLNLKISR